MVNAVKWTVNAGPIYLHCKKHFCPKCGRRLGLTGVRRVVNSKSPEAKRCDFSNPNNDFIGDVAFRTTHFYCPACKTLFSINEIRDRERRARKDKRSQKRVQRRRERLGKTRL